jgi:hypothetical protein
MHEPMFELIKQVRTNSHSWSDKQFALLELEADYERSVAVFVYVQNVLALTRSNFLFQTSQGIGRCDSET